MEHYTQANNLFITDELPVTYDKVQTQILVEKMYNKKQQRNLLRQCFKDILEPVKDKVLDENIVLDTLGILAIRQEIYVSSLVEMLIDKHQIDKSKQDIATCIVQAGTLGLYNGVVVNKNLKLFSKFSLAEKTLEILKQYQYLPPMIVPPLKVNQRNNNKGSGYYTIGSDSLILNANHHNNHISTDTLDTLNSIELTLNVDVIKTVRNNWSDLDKQREDESEQDYEDRVRAFENFEKSFMKTSAYLVNQGNKFYLTHKFDKRGRVYCCGYQANYQGNTFQKAVIEFNNKDLITEDVHWFEF